MDNKHQGERIIFVGGVPRSGTSMLQSMLDSHPDIFGGPEFDFIPAIINLRNQFLASVNSGRIKAFCDNKQVDRSFAELVENLLLPAASHEKKRWLSEKTPMNVLVFNQLLDIFPEARFIHVVRDPRAVALSMLKVADRYRQKEMEPPAIIANPEQVIQTILQYISAGIESSRVAPSRVYTIKYEKLLLNTEEATKDLCTFIGVDWSELMLHPEEQSHISGSISFADGGLWSGDRKIYRSPEKWHVDRWKEGLTKQQLEELADVFRPVDMYRSLGYRFDDV